MLSAHHAWLRFVAGGPQLPVGLRTDPLFWQDAVRGHHARWYHGIAPPAVSAVFVLQWLLQVPAHTAAHTAALGTWRALGLGRLTFALGPSAVPAVVRLEGLETAPGEQAARLDAAETDYRAVAEPIAARYVAPVRIGPHTRAALVDDMWTAARRDAERAAGAGPTPVPERASCCLIYALPGCRECAGCPRIRPSGAG